MVTLVCQEYQHCVIQPKWVDIAWPTNASYSTPNGAWWGLQMVPNEGFNLCLIGRAPNYTKWGFTQASHVSRYGKMNEITTHCESYLCSKMQLLKAHTTLEMGWNEMHIFRMQNQIDFVHIFKTKSKIQEKNNKWNKWKKKCFLENL